MHSPSSLPFRLVIVAGTYDGVLAGWDTEKRTTKKQTDINDKNTDLLSMLNPSPQDEDSLLTMNFAMGGVHQGSVRSLSIASVKGTSKTDGEVDIIPGTLLSTGYDESLAIFSLTKYVQAGELKTPTELGMPTCSSFAPPFDDSPSHVLVGLSSGKIVIYKRKDMSVQHILSGHDDKGVTCIAVHPSGKLALSGGRDGKIILWDLMRGKLAYVNKIPNASKGKKCTVNHIIWSEDGSRFAYCTHEGNINAREMESGDPLLDINLPQNGRANQICFIGGPEGLFLAAACNDGGLPVFAVGGVDENDEEEGTRRAIMAIEPVEGVASAGDERFKCIQSVKGGSGFLVVTANSGGIISLIDLEGAAQMMLSDESDGEEKEEDTDEDKDSDIGDSDDDEDEDVAAEFIESVRIGSGARITCIAVWSCEITPQENEESFYEGNDSKESSVKVSDNEDQSEEELSEEESEEKAQIHSKVRMKNDQIDMDPEALERARALVAQAKKRQKKQKSKKNKKSKT
jgi:WD40 repeat protein